MARTTSSLLAVMLLVPGMALFAFAPAAAADHTYFDTTVIAYDGTRLAATVFLPHGASASAPVPFVLMTHGWAGERVTEPTGRVADLLDAGYGVLTWDSRGFGASGGEVQLNSPDYEVKDVQRIIDHLALKVSALQKVGGDPVIGMSGGSYAGGIQLLAAAFDERIDAIAPEITWNDLVQSLAPNGVPKLYWTSLLLGAGAEASCVNARNGDPVGALSAATLPVVWSSSGCQTSDLPNFYARVHATNGVPDDVRDALLHRSPATYMDQIDIPTLLVQGFPDTLFDVNQAAANYEGIKANGAPVKMWLYDGGHGHPEGPALANTQAELISGVVINWFDRHLKGDALVDTGPEIEYFVDGAWHNATAWPIPTATPKSLHINGIPALVQAPIAGGPPATFQWTLMPGSGDVNVTTLAVGRASVAFNMTGHGTEGFVFLALAVKDAAGVLKRVDAQVQPIRAPISATDATRVEVDLVDVAAAVPGDGALVLTFASTDPNYNGNRVPGYVNVVDIDVSWQTV